MLSLDIYILNLLEQAIMHLSIFKAVETEFICRLNSSCSEFLSSVWRVKTFYHLYLSRLYTSFYAKTNN